MSPIVNSCEPESTVIPSFFIKVFTPELNKNIKVWISLNTSLGPGNPGVGDLSNLKSKGKYDAIKTQK